MLRLCETIRHDLHRSEFRVSVRVRCRRKNVQVITHRGTQKCSALLHWETTCTEPSCTPARPKLRVGIQTGGQSSARLDPEL